MEKRMTRRRATMLVAGLVALGASTATASTSAQQERATTVLADEIVASQLELGALVAIAPDGSTRTLVDGLADPHGVAVLDDGSILFADPSVDAVLGVGGRYGDAPEEVATVESAEGLAVGPDDSVYATGRESGLLVRIDPDEGGATTIVGGLASPYGVAAGDDEVHVIESATGRILSVDAETGVVTELAADPDGVLVGIASVGADTVVVSNVVTGELVGYSPFGPELLAVLDQPALLATEPQLATDPAATEVVVATATDAVRLGPRGVELARVPLDRPYGVAAVPDTVTAVTPDGATGDTSTTTAPEVDSATDDDRTAEIVAIVVAAIVLAAAAVITMVLLRRREPVPRPDTAAEEHFEAYVPVSRPPARTDLTRRSEPDATTRPAPTPRPPATSAVESPATPPSAEDRAAQDLRDAIVAAEAEALRKRDERANVEVDPDLEAAVDEGESDVESKRRRRNEAAAELARAEADHASTTVEGLDAETLGLRSERGRETFDAWQAGELTAVELRRRWLALGELDAIERVKGTGRTGSVPTADRVAAARRALEAAENDLSAAVRVLEKRKKPT